MYVDIVVSRMRVIRTQRAINATPETVWSVLTDLGDYRQWNPQTTSASGTVADGGQFELHVESTQGNPVTLHPHVTHCDRPDRVEWVASLPVPGLLRAQHTFELAELPDGRTRLSNVERLSGFLVRFVTDDETYRDYEAMNDALAAQAERLERGSTESVDTAEGSV